MLKQKVLLFSCFVLFSTFSFAQGKIDVNKDIDVLKVYSQYAENGYATASVCRKLANGYYFRSDYTKAKLYFEKLFLLEKPTQKQLKRYRQSLRALGIDETDNLYLAQLNT